MARRDGMRCVRRARMAVTPSGYCPRCDGANRRNARQAISIISRSFSNPSRSGEAKRRRPATRKQVAPFCRSWRVRHASLRTRRYQTQCKGHRWSSAPAQPPPLLLGRRVAACNGCRLQRPTQWPERFWHGLKSGTGALFDETRAPPTARLNGAGAAGGRTRIASSAVLSRG